MEGSVFRRTHVNAQRVFLDYAVNSVSLFSLSNYGNMFSGELKANNSSSYSNYCGNVQVHHFYHHYHVSSRLVALMYSQKYQSLFIVDQKFHGPVMYNYTSHIDTLIAFACFIAKCIIPCLNGGRCRGVNKCRCPSGFKGDHCEIGRHVPKRSTCTEPCEHGTCAPDNTCLCDEGWYGRLCHESK